MRGMMFVAFVDWMERRFGEDIADGVLCATPTATGGAYTNVGQYEYQELLALVTTLSGTVGQPASALCEDFGQFLLPVLAEKHQSFMDLSSGLRGFLQGLDSHIHKEVLRLYPNSLPPKVRVQDRASEDPQDPSIALHYESHRPMADLALGLLLGSIKYFKADATVTREDDLSRADFAHFRIHLRS